MFGSDARNKDLKYQLNSAAADIGEAKNVPVLNPLAAPDFYKQAMEFKRGTIASPDPAISAQPYCLMDRIEDKNTGFDAASYINYETGHAVLVFRGSNFPSRETGSSLGDFWQDVKAVMASNFGFRSRQLPQAEQAYIDLMKNPDVKSVELVGYSLGTVYVNYLAAKYGAYGTTIADLGLSANLLRSTFNEKALPDAYKRLRERTVDLVLEDDLIVRIFGDGVHRGRQIGLDTNDPSDLKASIHFVDVYLDKARGRRAQPDAVPA